jgi:hypothetical protein
MSQAPVYGAIEYEVSPGHIHQLIIDAGEILTYGVAVQQLFGTDFHAEQRELDRKIRVFKKWGGQVPAAVLMFDPDDRKQLNLLTTDQEGNPSLRKVTDKAMIDMIPYPDEKYAVKDREGVSWQRKRKLKAETKLRRLHDA